MIRRNRLFLTCAAVLLLALPAGCGGGRASGGKGPLLIGASVSLTGDFADSGKAVRRGYQLWADTVNAHGGLLGRKVRLRLVDDTSSPTQVVTNYQNLIAKDRVDLVFGPFSSLLTIPSSRVAKRYGYLFLEPSGGGPAVFAQKLDNFFFVQPAPVVRSGQVFADWVLSLPAAQRPRTAAYPELDDPFAAPIAEAIRTRFEAAGIRTVYKQVYPSETQDLSPVVAKVVAARPDVIVAGVQVEDAYSEVKDLVQLKFSPKALFMTNGANSPGEFPDKVGARNVAGVMSSGDWFPTSKEPGSAAFTAAYLKKYGGTADSIDNTAAEAYAVGQVLQAAVAKAGTVDNAKLIATLHKGSWPTLLGTLSWDSIGQPRGSFSLIQWQGGRLVPVFPAKLAQREPVYPKPGWGG